MLAIISCTGGPSAFSKLLLDPANELLQVRITPQHSIVMQVLSKHAASYAGSSKAPGILRIKLALRSNEKINSSTVMNYLNFGMQNSLYLLDGADTFRCHTCERIPGISEKEFLYMVSFTITTLQAGAETDLHLLIADTIAGFGTTVFDIKKDVLKEPDAKNWQR